ncbi:MAG: helix-turn-helix domain-containing protein [Rhodobacteraceae bacterium]|nr:helix-turn-helix domain-containing protein [Paracoccaceae bacterium]
MTNAAEVLDLTGRLPTREESASAAGAATALAAAQAAGTPLKIQGEDGAQIRLAPAIAHLMLDLLGHLSRGDMVTLVPTGALLTTQQAADILNVSRPYLNTLLKDDEIPYVRLGEHRRVKHADLMAYKTRRDASRSTALDELARLGQECDAS